MISILDVEKAMLDTLKKVFKLKVHGDNITTLKTPAFLIKLMTSTQALKGRRQIEKDLWIDIIYYAKTGLRAESLAVNEKLTSIFLPCFKVKDRAFTARTLESNYVDEDLHFLIHFNFYDTVEHIYVDNTDVITDKENEDKEIEHEDGTKTTVPMEKMKELYLILEEY